MKFTKMHGAGNDYIYINGFSETVDDPSELARQMSDRHKGVGSDGLVLILPSKKAHVRMRMFNTDGSESQMCGNAIRCVGKYAFEHGLVNTSEIEVETLAGVKRLWLTVEDGLVPRVTVDMGVPEWRPACIPVRAEGDSFLRQPLLIPGQPERQWEVNCVSMGNPHAVLFVPPVADLPLADLALAELPLADLALAELPLAELGPHIEHHSLFPERINTEWVQVLDSCTLSMRVWERGAGETLACGTGACAATVVAARLGLTGRAVTVRLRGGELDIVWQDDDHVFMRGEAVTVFEGRLY